MNWYENEVSGLEKAHANDKADPGIIFYGSSSIRVWGTLKDDFADRKVTNLGFGGSTLAACVWFFERIMMDYNPQALVFYAGDNDLGDGRHPEEVFIFFKQLMVEVKSRFGNLPCYFISLKPSVARWHLADQFKYTNNLIADEISKSESNWIFIDVFSRMLDQSGKPIVDNYQADGLHMTDKAYRLWTEIVEQELVKSLPLVNT